MSARRGNNSFSGYERRGLQTNDKMEMTMSNSNAFSMGFFSGLGSSLATMIFTFVGLLFFIPGLIMVMRQTKKPKEERSKGMIITGFVLMAIGMLFGMGMGLVLFGGLLFDNI